VRPYGDAGGLATMHGMSIIDTDALLKALGPQRARGDAPSRSCCRWSAAATAPWCASA
jgi:hypothetical protein